MKELNAYAVWKIYRGHIAVEVMTRNVMMTIHIMEMVSVVLIFLCVKSFGAIIWMIIAAVAAVKKIVKVVVIGKMPTQYVI